MTNKKINQKILSLIEYYNLLNIDLLINNSPLNKLKNKGKFISGPFKNLVFDIIEKHKNVLKIQTGNFTTTIIKNNYLSIKYPLNKK